MVALNIWVWSSSGWQSGAFFFFFLRVVNKPAAWKLWENQRQFSWCRLLAVLFWWIDVRSQGNLAATNKNGGFAKKGSSKATGTMISRVFQGFPGFSRVFQGSRTGSIWMLLWVQRSKTVSGLNPETGQRWRRPPDLGPKFERRHRLSLTEKWTTGFYSAVSDVCQMTA